MLYLITNRKIVSEGRYFDVIKDAILAGVDAIIVREKDLSTIELTPIVFHIKGLIDDYATKNVKLIVNSNEEVAMSVEADGLHLSFEDFVNNNRKFKGLIGVSVHSVEEAVLSEDKGANYLLASHIYPTKCKEGSDGRGLDFIKAIKSEVTIPVIALGGITSTNVQDVIETGVEGIAIMSYIMSAVDSYRSTSIIRNRINKFNIE